MVNFARRIRALLVVTLVGAFACKAPASNMADTTSDSGTRHPPLGSTTGSVTPLADTAWAIYYNRQYCYSIQYPRLAHLDTSLAQRTRVWVSVSVASGDVPNAYTNGYPLAIGVSPNPGGLTAQRWVARLDSIDSASSDRPSRLQITQLRVHTRLAGRTAYRIRLFAYDEDKDITYVPHDGLMYELSFPQPIDSLSDSDPVPTETFVRMMKSFMFVQSNNCSQGARSSPRK